MSMPVLKESTKLESFEVLFLPHLDAAYNLARWLTRHDQEGDDLVQEAYLRAWRAFDGFRGNDARPWLLKIVRNTCYTWLRGNRLTEWATFDEEAHSAPGPASNPEALLTRSADCELVQHALQDLSPPLREVIVLREFEALSYKEIAAISGIPLGTVMSRLARARLRMQQTLAGGMERPVVRVQYRG
jgi:RNA polymerase sigma-70 factor (ECF subfamily)